jgi:hypothetical protein
MARDRSGRHVGGTWNLIAAWREHRDASRNSTDRSRRKRCCGSGWNHRRRAVGYSGRSLGWLRSAVAPS